MRSSFILLINCFAFIESVDYEKLMREWDDEGDLIDEGRLYI